MLPERTKYLIQFCGAVNVFSSYYKNGQRRKAKTDLPGRATAGLRPQKPRQTCWREPGSMRLLERATLPKSRAESAQMEGLDAHCAQWFQSERLPPMARRALARPPQRPLRD